MNKQQLRLGFLLILSVVTGLFAGQVQAASQRPLMVPGELIVKFKPGASPLAIAAVAQRNALQRIRQFRKINAVHYRVQRIVDTLVLVGILRNLPEVEYAEPNYYRYLNVLPDDPSFSSQWALDNQGQTGGTVDADIDAPEAWDVTTGSAEVVVAVIDSGIDMAHEDLVDNLYVNPGEIADNGIDDDNNGFVDDVSGWDFIGADNDPSDPVAACQSHGSHTAGILGAVGNNGLGVTGVAQQVSILPLRVFRPILGLCSASVASIISAINYADMMGVDISNNSWGGGIFSQAMFETIAGARHLFVAAAGNEGRNINSNPAYPASYNLDHILAVAATDHNDQLAGFSNFGNRVVDLAAPGVSILSTVRSSAYGQLSGTSMATPYVAGAAAILLSADPGLTPIELKYKLMMGSDERALPVISSGRLNLFESLMLPSSPVSISLSTGGPTEISVGDPVSIDLAIVNNSLTTQEFYFQLLLWGPDGETSITGPVRGSLEAAESISTTLNGIVSGNPDPDSYRFIGRIVDVAGDFFEEDQVIYQIW